MIAADGLTNVVAGLGTDKDKARHAAWMLTPRTPEDWEAVYRSGWMARKIVDLPVDDMVRRWRGWHGSEPYVVAMEAAEQRHHVRDRLASAVRWARLYGASALIVGLSPRLGMPSDPLDVSRVRPGDLTYLHVDVSTRLVIETWEDDLASPRFGGARTYLYHPVVRGGLGQSVRVHASRVIPFSGAPLPPLAASMANTWGDSVFVALEQAINTAGTALAVIASLLHEAKIDVMKTDLSVLDGSDGEARLIQRFQLANTLKSLNNMLLMGTDEGYEQKTINFAGLPEIHIRLLQEVSGAADIPVTRFLGQSPAGLQSTGESDLRNYYDMISARQESILRPALERLDPILAASAGIKPEPDAHFTFHPLWQESETQKAENAYKRSQAIKLIADTGLIPAPVMTEALVSQLVEAGTYPALDASMAAYRKEVGDDLDGIGEDDADNDDAPEPIGRPALRVVGDGTPRSLYVSRKVLNAAEILRWARAQGIEDLVPADDLHVTVAFSRDPLDWFAVSTAEERILVPRGGPRALERFDGGALVLLFSDWSLRWRHESLRDAGASWDHPEYQPHITLSYGASNPDPRTLTPYTGKIALGPEIFEEVDDSRGTGTT